MLATRRIDLRVNGCRIVRVSPSEWNVYRPDGSGRTVGSRREAVTEANASHRYVDAVSLAAQK